MRWNSRKLMVTIASVIGIPAAELPEEAWWVALGYIFIQGIVDGIEKWRSE